MNEFWRIGVVDDHDVVVDGVVALLRTLPVQAVLRANDVDGLLAQSTDLDLVVLDLRLADGSSPRSNVDRLRRAGAEVLAFTSGEDAALVRQAAGAGLAGMIGKGEGTHRLLTAVRQVLAGEIVESTEWAAALDGDPAGPPVPLSPREAQVLELYASGHKADSVARRLGISRETVLFHIRNIRSKYADADRRAPTKVDLYRRAVEDGLLQDR